MHGNLKVVLDIPIRNRYVVGFKTKEDMGQIITCLGTDDYEETLYKEYILKAFFSGKVTSVDHPISLLNQISLLYNLCQLSVAHKDFTTTQSLITMRVWGILTMSYQCYKVSSADSFLKSRFVVVICIINIVSKRSEK